MNKFIDACIGHYRTVLLVLLLVFVTGVVAYQSIPKERTPDIQIPIIFVSMTHEGISPEDAERLLIRPMEKELRAIEGVKEVTAYAIEGMASVTLEFNAGFDSDKALNNVREKVDIARAELPEDTDEPEVNEVNLSLFPVLNVMIMGNIPQHALVATARRMRDKIEELPNVLSVNIGGDREEAVEIEIDPMIVESYGLTMKTLGAVSSSFNRLIASGALDNGNGRYSVKVPGLLENLHDILSLPVKVSGDSVVTVADIAKIKKTFKEPQGFARVNGMPAIVLEVSKRTGTNVIETIQQVKELVELEKLFLPKHVEILYAQDNSERVMAMLSDLESNIILAILLVMMVIIYFVGFRSAALVTVAIPGAFLIGILFLAMLNLTLNIVVLFSLILSIGMLVDSAIVVCEMADRKITEGESYKTAYATAAKYMKWPIIASTVTTLVVFMPLLSWPSTIGQFMKYMPITLIATLSGSLLMALIFVPTIGSILNVRHRPSESSMSLVKAAERGSLDDLDGFTYVYYKFLAFVVRHAVKFTIVIFGLLCFVYGYYIKFGTGMEFFPSIEPDSSQIQVRARGNLSIKEKDTLLQKVEEKILDINSEVSTFYAKSGKTGNTQGLPEDTIGTIQLEYADWQSRRKAVDIIADIKERTFDIPGVLVNAQDNKPGPGKAKPIEIELSSRYPEELESAVENLLLAMSNIEGLVDIEDSRPVPGIEWKMEPDREMIARFGSDIGAIGNYIKLVTNGMRVTDYRPNDADDEVDILVRFPKEKRNLSTLDSLKIITSDGAVPISNFVKRTAKPKIETIYRTDGMRVMNVKANVAKGVLADSKVREAKKMLAQMQPNSKVNIKFKGDDKEQAEAMQFLMSAFILALFCMALILVTQFNSVYYMIIILSAVFLSTVGVLLGLIITGQPFGVVMCGVGIISLSGIVVNNNIIFIDTFTKLKDGGMGVEEALLRTGVQRLRPILLTAGTTVLGLLPMVLGMNIDFITREVAFGAPSSQWWRQLSTAIAGGLSFATILTLFFTPSLLIIGDRVSGLFVRRNERVMALE